MRNTVWFTNILIKKEEHVFDVRTIGVQNKILCIDKIRFYVLRSKSAAQIQGIMIIRP